MIAPDEGFYTGTALLAMQCKLLEEVITYLSQQELAARQGMLVVA